jgi:hypothetical protein
LRILQAISTPPLDLLVRESIQNSLDAAESGTNVVHVAFNVYEFDEERFQKFANLFPQISRELSKRFANRQTVLEIRDTGTTGLTGSLTREPGTPDGNLLKLVYDVSSPQQRAGAGGSWGLGKTCYYRMGIGLVVYYSRIELREGEYQSRLVACLVENLQDEERVALLAGEGVPENTGIAWWGSKENAQSTPLTDEGEIAGILRLLGVKPFEAEQKGTCVVIPFLREDLTESDQLPWENSQQKPFWSQNLCDNLIIVVQRWYAPRLNNPDYAQGPFLRASVGGIQIGAGSFTPLASTLRRLYRAIPFKDEPVPFYRRDDDTHGVVPVKIVSTFEDGPIAGWVSWVLMTNQELAMTPPNNMPSPNTFSTGKPDNREPPYPLLAMVRAPGMVIRYATAADQWVSGIDCPDGYRLIALFALNGQQKLKEAYQQRHGGRTYVTLEDYIRATELATHNDWEDLTGGFNIVSRIISNSNRKLREAVDGQSETTGPVREVGGSQFIGQLLVPLGFGDEPTAAPSGFSNSGNGGGRSSDRTQLVTTRIAYAIRPERSGNISLDIAGSGNRHFSANTWTQEGLVFPFSLLQLCLNDEVGNQLLNFPLKGKSITRALDGCLEVSFDESQQDMVSLTWNETEHSLLHGKLVYFSSNNLMARIKFKANRGSLDDQ